MKALLTTRCGCTRTLDITYPPPPEIVVPLRADRMSVWFDENQEPIASIGARRFEFYRCDGCSPYAKAEYLEK